MKPVHQTLFVPEPGDPGSTGNCMAACVASLLELDLEDVPNFAAAPQATWWGDFQWWLYRRGWVAVVLDGNYDWPGYSAASGWSPRGDFKHLVIHLAGKLAHDPHPSGAGLRGDPVDQWILVPLDPGAWARRAVRSCSVCGCTDAMACDGGCWWVAADLCSACQTPQPESENA